mmetsp:Transcript_8785/g.21449  ORF Transcript_8785/g.21449 Transcript_8785/m.21449 type:complete len:416 (+) Transcript_8785:168-1415(+)|eukprot:CAMPEP_0197191000 /NCGR_PEP_ID=MMETSP1423-20130617/22610_1 /TAXON_ID=476441 /ORGANISM="Pseudo-nitzschia heimii, Strain UNC1101" /LENGTH=415 /DNA_ID=CAMNT_0042643513 /DNA_START=164 /DNA_END=1411 /DNA_ORIENTATION=+
MTADLTIKEEANDASASLNDPIETPKNMFSLEAGKEDYASNVLPNECKKSSDGNEAMSENETTGDPPRAKNPPTGERSTEQTPGEASSTRPTAPSTSKANKEAEKQKKIEPSNIIKTPNVHDVLLGRGKPFQNHDGNQSMLRIVDMYRKRYHESERAFKHEIIEEVLDIIKSKGGRFLERIDDFEKSFWNQVPHRMAYRKVGHAFRSNARRISMEKRDQANNQRRNASAMARASMMSQFMTGNEGILQRMPMQAVALPEMMQGGGRLGFADSMGIGGSVYNDNGGISPAMFRQGGGATLNHTQRELLAQEQMLHSSRIERILGGNGNNLNRAASSQRFDSVQSMLGGGDSLPFAGNLTGNPFQLNNMRRMMLLGSAGVANHPNTYTFSNAATTTGSRIPNMGLSNMGNIGDAPFK